MQRDHAHGDCAPRRGMYCAACPWPRAVPFSIETVLIIPRGMWRGERFKLEVWDIKKACGLLQGSHRERRRRLRGDKTVRLEVLASSWMRCGSSTPDQMGVGRRGVGAVRARGSVPKAAPIWGVRQVPFGDCVGAWHTPRIGLAFLAWATTRRPSICTILPDCGRGR